MRPQRIVGALALCICASGCQLTADITHNLVFETCLFASEVRGKVYYRRLACSAWKKYRAGHPERAGCADFAKGFKLGYADYLENGGCGGGCDGGCDGSSHALPPLRYWKIRYETPEGRAATVSWLDGFREGAAAAKASGYRGMVIVPVGTSGLLPDGASPPSPNAPSLGNAPPAPGAPTEELPVPHSLPASPEAAGAPFSPETPQEGGPEGPPAESAPAPQMGLMPPTMP